MRHLYANFKKKFPGKNLKALMWEVAHSIYPQQWEKVMRKIKEVNIDAFKHMLGIPSR